MIITYRGQTALHKAAWYQRRTICRMLVQAGSSLLIKDKQVSIDSLLKNYHKTKALCSLAARPKVVM